MKYFIIAAMLLCSAVCYAGILPDKFGGDEEKSSFKVTSTPDTERIKKMEQTLDKIYSMLADLHIKQMGIDRGMDYFLSYELIGLWDNQHICLEVLTRSNGET